jgi:hypothetical protein
MSRQSARVGGKLVSPMHRQPLPPGNIPGTHLRYRLNQPYGQSIKNPNISTRNRNRELPASSAVVQPTAPPCATTPKFQNMFFTHFLNMFCLAINPSFWKGLVNVGHQASK